jgi:hypothetical protein
MGMNWGIALMVVGTAWAMEVPARTKIEIRLTSAVNTAMAKVDQAFDAVVTATVVAANQFVVAAGVKVTGHVKEVKAAVNPDDQAVLGLVFDQISDARGKKAVLEARLVGVDNARESVDKDGRILGIIASQTGSGRLDQGINKVTEKYPVGAGRVTGHDQTGRFEAHGRQRRLRTGRRDDHRADQSAGVDGRCESRECEGGGTSERIGGFRERATVSNPCRQAS